MYINTFGVVYVMLNEIFNTKTVSLRIKGSPYFVNTYVDGPKSENWGYARTQSSCHRFGFASNFFAQKTKVAHFCESCEECKTWIYVIKIEWPMAIFPFSHFGYLLLRIFKWHHLKRGCEDKRYFLEINSSPSVLPLL